MLEIVFWDTAAFVALGNRDDELHAAAIMVSVVMQDRKVNRAFTSDHHFAQAGYERLM